MVFRVSVVFFSKSARLVTLANVIAEGARAVEGADVRVLRVRDTIRGEDDASAYDRGILDCAVATPEDILESDCIIFGSPTRHGRVAPEMSAFFDRLAAFHSNGCALKGKIGSSFTEVGGAGQGYGGHEICLMTFHSFFLQHGMIAVGVPPLPVLETAPNATVFGTTISATTGRGAAGPMSRIRELSEEEVKLAYAQGEWASVIGKQLHDDGEMLE
uniref:NAD(P)H dehydrogenase (quinone) n=1 Tax=Ostreococcus sp. 'lucimarinus' TaxID=242159 RepID=A0A7R9XR84_9CHLO